MRKLMAAAALVAVMGLAAQAATAQTRRNSASSGKLLQFGPQADFATQSIGLGVGGRVIYNLGTTVNVPGLKTHASFDYFFPGNSLKFWEINAAGTYDLQLSGLDKVMPYVGAALTYANSSCTGCTTYSNTGLSLLGGGRFKMGASLHAFAEARFELRSGGAVVFTGGLLF